MYGVEKREHKPVNFFAGGFPTVSDTATAGAELEEFTPVAKDESGKIVPVTAETAANVIGITATTAKKDEPVVYYMTGEFFADALNMPEGVDIENIKEPLRKFSIFLK
jgi:hypothetical protein